MYSLNVNLKSMSTLIYNIYTLIGNNLIKTSMINQKKCVVSKYWVTFNETELGDVKYIFICLHLYSL